MPVRNPGTHASETAGTVDHFVYSPASSYPKPYARLIDRSGAEVHLWSHDAGQPPVEEDPPSFLRGWNHVEVAADGGLFAQVPLRALLRLDRDSTLLWQADVSAHHDLHIRADGTVLVLTEAPRRITVDHSGFTVLDNAVTLLDGGDGHLVQQVSLLDVLGTEPTIAALIRERILAQHAAFREAAHPTRPEEAELLASATYSGSLTHALALLRRLPGSPCDILHANTVEELDAHPAGLWPAGAVLASLRNLDLVAIVDLDAARVLWWWGPGDISGQHQPTALPHGNLLIFDNGRATGRSRVVEVDPVRRAVVWEYAADPPESFFTALAGGSQPLPSGNILVTDAQAGRGFEITRAGAVTWEWYTEKVPGATGTSRVTLYRLAGVSGAIVEGLRSHGPAAPGSPA
ncbi:arylsulfotransferase family protein [Streptomyces chartreusis]|uniref:arylsulfotransferase family protein n=1 Tax=Streptomyces chartreusis TaxID=1969 RepID=UPI00382A58A6